MKPRMTAVTKWTGCWALLAALCACGPVEAPGAKVEVEAKGEGLVTAAAPPVVARSHHRLGLRNGLVYAVGGNTSLAPSVEVLDPATNAWSAGPALLTNRRDEALVTLDDGTFLVFGGIGASGVLSSAEKLAPGASAWEAIAPMPAALYGQSATLLSDGRVLVAGGVGYVASARIYDPAANTWTATGSMVTGRMLHGAARLPDGRVLVAGGCTASTCGATSAEVWSPTTGAWSPVGPMPTASGQVDIAVVNAGPHAGWVLVGASGSAVDQFSPATSTFSSFFPSLGAHYQGTLFALADGSVLLYGDSYGVLSMELLGASASSWTVVDQMPATRMDSPAVQLADGRVVVVGGTAFPAGGGNEFARADAFSWSPSSGTCVPRTCAAAGATCGTIGDLCGGTLSCGTCGSGQVCSNNTCVAACVPLTCASIGATCGSYSDGCGGSISCGTCGSGQVCSASHTCVPACVPTTCAALGLTCGTAPDGCGGTLTCGPACGSSVAVYDATLKAPLCASPSSLCSATTTGRANLGPEVNAPNTLGSTCADGIYGSFHSDESVDAVRVRSTTGGVLTPGGAAQVEVDVWAWAGYSSDALDVFVTTNPSAPVWTLLGTRIPTRAGAQTITVPFTLPSGASGRYAVRAQFRYGGSATACDTGGYTDHDDVVFAVGSGGGGGITNGDFESGLNGWSVIGSVNADSTPGLSHGGTTHAALHPYWQAAASMTQSVTVPAGTTTFSFWVRPETALTNSFIANISVQLSAPGITTLNTAVATTLMSPGVWTNYTLDVTRFAGSNATLMIYGQASATMSTELFRVDDVSFR